MVQVHVFLITLAVLSLTSSSHARRQMKKVHHHIRKQESNSVEAERKNINQKENNKNFEVCETMECRQLGKAFGETLDKSVDPCKDFYEFSCGGWEEKKPIPNYEHSWDRFSQFQFIVENRIREELEAEPKAKEILPVQKARKWYHSCMDFESREARGIKPIESIIMQVGGWPMVMDAEEWNEESSWEKVDNYYLRVTGKYAFYDMKAMRLPSVNESHSDGILQISEGELPLTDELPLDYRTYEGDDLVSYKLLINSICQLFIDDTQANVSDEELEKDIKDLIEFEKAIYTAMTDPESLLDADEEVDRGSYLYEEGFHEFNEWWNNSTATLDDSYIKIDWKNIIQRLFNLGNVEFDVGTQILFESAKYFRVLSKLLQSTDKRTIVNYIHWQFVSKALKYTIDEVKDVYKEIVKDEYGVQERPPRWRECLREMEMEDALSFIFVEKYFQQNTSAAADKMLQNVKEALKKQIENSNWMSSDAKEASIEKINKMKALIGFPDWYKNKTAIINHYKGLIIGYDYLDNILSSMRYKKRAQIRRFMGYEGNARWEINPITVNAIYMPSINMLTAPAVDFQSPLFGLRVPDYVNYGIAGSTIGHEIGHGFDPTGIHFGVKPESELLTDDMLRMYYQRSDCFIKQYNHYFNESSVTKKPGESLRDSDSTGSKTVEENMADMTGVQTIFDAYMRVRKEEKPNGEVKLPGFEDFTDEQMFFISYAAQWCQVSTEDFKKRQQEMQDPHSPGYLRVIGPVSNTLDFAKAFNCPKNSPMNPENKCEIWMKPGASSMLKKSRRSRRRHNVYY